MSRPVFIEGESINLVPLTVDDAELCFAWQNDLGTILAYGSHPMPTTVEKEKEHLAKLADRKNLLILGIQRRDTDELIGFGGLTSIEWINQRAELTICIGVKDARGKGFGTEATRMILDHAFRKLNLHSVMLRVIDYNQAGIHCYEKSGFKLIGLRREAKPVDGAFHDVLYMDILAKEFLGEG